VANFKVFVWGCILKILMPEITRDLHVRINEADTVVPFLLTDDQKLLSILDIICYRWNQVMSVANTIFKDFIHSGLKSAILSPDWDFHVQPFQGVSLLFNSWSE